MTLNSSAAGPAAQSGPDQQKPPLLVADIMKVLPHRPPFLLLDRVLTYGEGQVHAVKQVSIGEPHFAGHFPDEPVMPGVLITEAMAQACMFALEETMQSGLSVYLAGIDGARFKRKVVPGDTLHLYGEILMWRRGIGKGECRAEVDGELAAKATLTFAVR